MSMSARSSKSRSSDIFLAVVEPTALLYIFSLLYKIQALGILCLMVMTVCGLFLRTPKILANQIAFFSVLYILMSTVTAFMFDFNLGVYKSLQATFIIAGMLGWVKFWYSSSQKTKDRFVKHLIILVLLVFLHMVIYHVSIGIISPWKYLYNTKTTISLIVIIFFTMLTPLREKFGPTLTLLTFVILSILVLLSGERKAYMLLALLFAVSIFPLRLKALITLLSLSAIILFVMIAPEGNNIKRQLESSIGLSQQTAARFDHYRHEDLKTLPNLNDYSDLTREYVNTNTWNLFKQNPIFGLGAGGYQNWANMTFGNEYYRGVRMNVHGEINRIPAESGIVGILIGGYCFMLFFLTTLKLDVTKRAFSQDSRLTLPTNFLIFVASNSMFEALDSVMMTYILIFGLFLSMENKKHDIRRQ